MADDRAGARVERRHRRPDPVADVGRQALAADVARRRGDLRRLPDRPDHRRATGAARRGPGPVGDGDLRAPDRRPGAARSERCARGSPSSGHARRRDHGPRHRDDRASSPDEGWIVLFYFASTAASMLLPERRAIALIVAPGVCAPSAWRASPTPPTPSSRVCPSRSSGSPCSRWPRCVARTPPCVATRQELAALAVAEERNRIARDLHDVLGHSLSLIAIKSELAGRLLPGDPERARSRSPTSRGSPANHWPRSAKRSAAIASRRSSASWRTPRSCWTRPGSSRPSTTGSGSCPAEDAVLAWALREAVTNVVRHSAARHGTIRTTRTGARPNSRSSTTGRRRRRPDRPTGSGLAGLRERLERIGGRLEAGRRPRAATDWSPRSRSRPSRPGRDARRSASFSPRTSRWCSGRWPPCCRWRTTSRSSRQVSNGALVVPEALAVRPDVAVLDIEMPGMDGLAAAAALRRRCPAAVS